MRRQPGRIVDGRFEGGYTGLFELICPGCGDHPYLDYAEIPPRLQWLRGPRTLQRALAVYDKHLGPPGTNGDSAGSLRQRPGLADSAGVPAARSRSGWQRSRWPMSRASSMASAAVSASPWWVRYSA